MPERFSVVPTRLTVVAVVLLVLGGLVAGVPAPAAAGPGVAASTAAEERGWRAKVAERVETRLDRRGSSDFVVTFDARADLGGAAGIADWGDRGEYVVDRLVDTATRSQQAARSVLRAEHADFQPFWIANVIVVHDGDSALAKDLAALPAVERLAPAVAYQLPEPDPATAEPSSEQVEWNVAAVGADRAWADFDARGQGIVIGSIDTGVQFQHPALVGHYRGAGENGTFTHDYNWFDPAGVCGEPSAGPCDNISHGTHTVGTMVGDDGAGNRIGVAPGATWIAAKGCLDEQRLCPPAALLASAQWMLAPTDLAGEHPRPDLRPDVVNNSWGEDNGSVENPWFDDALASWEAAGMFAVFSNGNFGPSCDTAGSPADSPLGYGVGAFDSEGAIAEFSSRGPGADGAVRPDISAPGVAVRSSVPDNRYAAGSGTSMAAPHVAATVALMWSVAPALAGDPAATREILDDSAVDVGDLTCGGTPDDNNVWGEGRLDSRAAVAASPRGEVGDLSGRVTDAATGEPVRGARVAASSASYKRSTTTDADGRYHLALVAGDYDVTVTAYGFVDATAAVPVPSGSATTRDVGLTGAPMTTVSGRVTDGSGQGFPLYATITVEDVPLDAVHTDPETGAFEIVLPRDDTYTAHVRPLYPGYRSAAVELTTDGDTATRDVSLTVDDTECVAPGYASVEHGLFEDFDDRVLPDGWSVVLDTPGRGDGWEFDDPGGHGNLTGGEGGFATIDSASGSLLESASLVTPPIDLSDETEPVLSFRSDHVRGGARLSVLDVDLSTDDGATWANVWHHEGTRRGPELIALDLPQAAGLSGVRVRFHYHQGWTYEGWWDVDDVLLGRRTCEPVDGGLVVGTVTDDLDHKSVVGAAVEVAGTEVSTLSTPPEADPAEDDGFYWLFSPTGDQRLAVSHDVEQYGARTRDVDVQAGAAVRADLELGQARLEVSSSSVSSTVDIGNERAVTLTVRNTGTAPASYDVVERRPSPVREPAGGDGARLRRVEGLDTGGRVAPDATADAGDAPAVEDGAWRRLADMDLANADSLLVRAEGRLYNLGGQSATATGGQERVYDIATDTWSRIARMPVRVTKPAGGYIDGRIYVVGGWEYLGDAVGVTQVYDPATDTWSRGADLPTGVAAAGYAVAGDTLYVIGGRPAGGEVGTREVWAYDAAGDAWNRVADYPVPISWPSCGIIDGLVHCAAGMIDGATRVRLTYAYDPATDTWYRLADTPKTVWGNAYAVQGGRLLMAGGNVDGFISNEGFAYDPAADEWSALPYSSLLNHRTAGACGFYKLGGYHPPLSLEDPWGNMPWLEQLTGAGECDSPTDAVPWLDVDQGAGTIEPGESVTVTVHLRSARTDVPGTERALLLLRDTARGAVPAVDVRLDVTAPASWGGIAGTVTGPAECGSPGDVPLAGAEVRIDGRFDDATIRTDAKGRFEYWLPVRNVHTTVTATVDGRPRVSRRVQVRASREVTADLRVGC
jgi:subtilisin family serine protease